MLGILLFGLVGTEVELVLLNHYEDAWQFAPLILIVVALVALAAHQAGRGAASLRMFQGIMVLFVIAGLLGVVLHFKGAAEFQLEMDPSQSRWSLFANTMRAHAPPVLAPGLMAQLGLLGLAFSYRHSDEGV
jgi:hypothetical protein